MASTRNINAPGNYKLEQRQFENNLQYNTFENSAHGSAYNPAFIDLGMNPTHMCRNNLSYNPIEIESSLFGINSTNLVNPQKEVHPELKELDSKKLFNRIPMIMPIPLAIENDQRPFPI
tara:strand:- start:43 stop:399 length:357 start_codon:yes stop_codon:yes gene_type:complete